MSRTPSADAKAGGSPTQRPNYGIDAPNLVRTFFGVAGVGALVAVAALVSPWPPSPWGLVIAAVVGCLSAYPLGMGVFMIYSSLVTKVRNRELLLDLVPWTGAEAVLDVGCGRGLVMVGAARRLTTGTAVGVDLWKAEDQSGNRPEAAVENARREGVDSRVEVKTADMKQLPFPDATFDVIVSHWAVHNLYEAAERAQALTEMCRVLKPGGHLIVADIQHHDEYTACLTKHDLIDIRVDSVGWNTAALSAISWGSFRPLAVVARKAG